MRSLQVLPAALAISSISAVTAKCSDARSGTRDGRRVSSGVMITASIGSSVSTELSLGIEPCPKPASGMRTSL